ncbi:MAG: hypothetical protein IH589_09140 [Anaerolineales bacterium]|nr:hypothetical protein [Anaerolineales bacterium]
MTIKAKSKNLNRMTGKGKNKSQSTVEPQHDDTSQSEGTSQIYQKQSVKVTFPERDAVYYSVTEAEINNYAQLGWLATLFLTFFGVFAGLLCGGLIAIQQGGLSEKSYATIYSINWFSSIVGMIFLLLAILLMVLQSKSKKDWKSGNK